jgi:cobalt-zinc-cadmium efflux system outer membrane protein
MERAADVQEGRVSMARSRTKGVVVMAAVASMIATGPSRQARAQAPTIEETGLLTPGGMSMPGGIQSLLGPMPGGGANLGTQPGRDEMLFGGRAGPSVPRVPTSITMPGGTYQGPQRPLGIAAPEPLPVPQPPFHGTLEVGTGPEDQGPPDGLTLDQAIEIFVHQNLNLRALALELPQARADVLTASLRANPILYDDAQLVPYGSFNRQRPGGPTQYDLNISHPLDYSHKRQARTNYAEVSLRVMEHQYQDAVRRGIGELYLAYVDALAARRTVHYAQVFAQGTDEYLRDTEALYRRAQLTLAAVDQARSEKAVAAASLADAEEALRQRKRTLAALLNLPPAGADRLELRGTLEDPGSPPPPDEELYRLALQCRPDVASFRLGVQAAEAAYRLARANRFADAYLLYQPFTYQNNAPFGTQSATSWALGITVPLPVYNRNQGNIERARINIIQSQVQLSDRERQVIMEVQQAIGEYRISGRIVSEIRDGVLPHLKRAISSQTQLFKEGEVDVFAFLNQRRSYNDRAKAYLDSSLRHRKAMLTLNTAVGQRILP